MIQEDKYKKYLIDADKLIHKKDIPYFALALSLSLPIWSDETDFKKQSKIQIYNTKQLSELLSNEDSKD